MTLKLENNTAKKFECPMCYRILNHIYARSDFFRCGTCNDICCIMCMDAHEDKKHRVVFSCIMKKESEMFIVEDKEWMSFMERYLI